MTLQSVIQHFKHSAYGPGAWIHGDKAFLGWIKRGGIDAIGFKDESCDF